MMLCSAEIIYRSLWIDPNRGAVLAHLLAKNSCGRCLQRIISKVIK